MTQEPEKQPERLADAVREGGQAGNAEDETHFVAEELSAPAKPITWSVYDDPAGRQATSLLAGLMSQPATQQQHPIENQFSEVLSFLIGKWPSFGVRFAMRCGSDQQLEDAVTAAEVIGTRTRLSLPVASAGNDAARGFLFPDISIEGSDRTFQILLEVKVDAEPHFAVVGGERLSQPDAYAAAWRRIQDRSPARTRRVCTLTREPLDIHGADSMRNVSLTWADVAGLVADERAAGVPAELALIVDEFHRAITDRILPVVIDLDAFAYVLGVASPLLDGFVETIMITCSGAMRSSPLRLAEDFVRRYVYLEVQGQTVQLLARLSPAGGRYNVPGLPATIGLQFMTDSNETLPAAFEPIALACGMQQSRNRAGYTGLRRFVDLPLDLNAETAEQLGAQLAAQIAGALT